MIKLKTANRAGLPPGKPVLYFFHGLPGSPRDADLLDELVHEKYEVRAFDFLASFEENGFDGVLRLFDGDLNDRLNETVHVAGFSLGAMLAIHVAARRPEQVRKLILISPAAPLELGDFLPHMAGKPVFLLAKRSPLLLALVTYLQAALIRSAPQFLIKKLFSKAGAIERDWLSNFETRETVESGLKHSLHRYSKGYRSLLRAYVREWSGVVRQISCETEIWHGLEDTWSPISMSHALLNAIEGAAQLQTIQETEHYTTLAKALT